MEKSMVKSSVNEHTMSLLNAMEKKNKFEIQNSLSRYSGNGVMNFGLILSIPNNDRLKGLCAKLGDKYVHSIIGASLSSAFDVLCVKDISGELIFEISLRVIEEAGEDNLSMEDFMIFLRGMIAGKFGKIYNRMDMPTFFELFENYRQQRHEALLEIRYEQQVNHKSAGPTERESDNQDREKELTRSAIGDYLREKYK